MAKKPFQLRLSPEVFEALEKWAGEEYRSLNGQIEYLLVQALKRNNRLKKEYLSKRDEEEKDV